MANEKEQHHGTGRRKTSVARVRITAGNGKLMVNQREADKYFTLAADRGRVLGPLNAVGCGKELNVSARVNGGGPSGQSGAVQLGIARALLKYNPEFEAVLRENKFLTRDSRMKERKKYGRAGARRSFQFSKR